MGGHSSGLFPGVVTSANDRPYEVVNDSMATGVAVNSPPPYSKNTRIQLLEEATTNEAKGIINELYRRNATIGNGGTADAIREQLRSGNLVGGKDHIRKGRERLCQIEKILAKNPRHPDRVLLGKLRDDLKDALGGV